jgi:hypothetical protein
MAVPTAITNGVQTVTSTGAVSPTAGVSIANVVGDFTACLLITNMTAGKSCRIQLEASSNSFETSDLVAVFEWAGLQMPQADLRVSWRRYQLPSSGENDFGVMGVFLRANVTQLDAGATLACRVWLEQ